MVNYFRDISSLETEAILTQKQYGEFFRFFGRATCLDISKFTMQGILDLESLKAMLNSLDLDISKYSIVLFYTGHYDRFYNTSLWLRSKPFISYSTISYLHGLGISSFGIDAPYPFGSLPMPLNLDISFTVGLCDLGHLCGKDFIYLGFPVNISPHQKKYIPRAIALQSIL